MKNYQPWENARGKIVSKKGGWRIGRGIESHGYNLIDDLVGHHTYMQIVVLNATGRMPSRNLAEWMEAAHVCLSWPDARIWCNRIGALGGSANAGPIPTVSGGLMAQDSTAYGSRTLVGGLKFISKALKTINSRKISVEEFVEEEVRKSGGKPFLMGFARPIAKGDERVNALDRVASNLEFEHGSHLKLAFQIEKELSCRFDETMNINGYVSAFMCDRGYTASEASRLFAVVVASGITACYVDNIDNGPGMFAPIRTADVIFEGKSSRSI